MGEFAPGSIRLYHRVHLRRMVGTPERSIMREWLDSKEAKGKYTLWMGDDIDPTASFAFTNRNTAFAFKLRFG